MNTPAENNPDRAISDATKQADRDNRGYRVAPGVGPRIRSDVVDVYIARRVGKRGDGSAGSEGRDGGSSGEVGEAGVEMLQLQRNKNPLRGTWQPVMGHVEAGETAVDAALREMQEETGLVPRSAACLGVWALERVHPFYIAAIDCVVLSPRFVAVVDGAWSPVLNAEHSAHRWVSADAAREFFVWPGQWDAISEAVEIVLGRSLAMGLTRVV